MMFAARQLQEKCQKQNADLYSTYFDLTKAIDTAKQRGSLEDNGKVWLPTKVHCHCSSPT